MAQATNPHTTSRFHNLSSGALADALGRSPRERNRRHGLPNLTGEDLKELGVNALGHRRCLTPLRLSEVIRKRRYPKHLRQSTGLQRTLPSVAKSR